jgi:GTPase SAR1 family protein
VGNKADLTGNGDEFKEFNFLVEQRQVTFQEGMDLAKKNNLRFFETSAKTGMNVDNVLKTLPSFVS